MGATLALLQNALAGGGYRLDQPIAPYQAAEPGSFAGVPRSVYQISTPDPDAGFVVIYEFPDAATASARGQELAAFLGSGFGQTNYPFDAQFAVSQVGGTIIFTWWSADQVLGRRRRAERLRPHRQRGPGNPRHQVGPRPRRLATPGSRRRPAAPLPPGRGRLGFVDVLHLERHVDAGPGAHLVAADLERVGAREVGLGPEAPARRCAGAARGSRWRP